MKTISHIAVTTLLLLTTYPLCAEDKTVERVKDNVTDKKEIPKKVVYVGGSVQRPGKVEYKKGASIYAMIMAAGGPSEFGTLKRVSVIREGKRTVYDMTQEKLQSTILSKPDDTYEVASTWLPAG